MASAFGTSISFCHCPSRRSSGSLHSFLVNTVRPALFRLIVGEGRPNVQISDIRDQAIALPEAFHHPFSDETILDALEKIDIFLL